MGKHHRHHSSRSRSRHSRSRHSHSRPSRRRYESSSSRSRDRSHRQKEKQKSHSRHEKKFMFDSPPREGQPFQVPIEKTLPQLPVQPNLSAFQNAQQVQQSELMHRVQALMASGGMDPNSMKDPKADKKLYVGNLPANITPQMLCDAINLALIKMNINQNPPGNSALSAWISTDGHYAFVEFRTAQEATTAFCLNNVAIFGQPLKVGRPKQYTGSQIPPTLPQINLQNDNLATNNNIQPYPQVERIHPPSKILVLKNMIQQHELEIDEEFNEIKEDVKEECNKYGSVVSLKIPRPGPSGIIVYGIGKIFVEFDSVDSAKMARKNLVGRTFSNKTVECAYHSEFKYAQNDFSDY